MATWMIVLLSVVGTLFCAPFIGKLLGSSREERGWLVMLAVYYLYQIRWILILAAVGFLVWFYSTHEVKVTPKHQQVEQGENP